MKAFLKRAEALTKQLIRKEGDEESAALHGKPKASVLYRNLPKIQGSLFQCPEGDEARVELALEIDQTMREKAPAGWKGDDVREKQVLNALYPLMSRDREATQAPFELIKKQAGYGCPRPSTLVTSPFC